MKRTTIINTTMLAACFVMFALAFVLVNFFAAPLSLIAAWSAFGLLGAGMTLAIKDDDPSLKKTVALPASDTTVASAGIDLGHGGNGDFAARAELLVSAPALAVGELANASTMIYDVYHDTASDFGSEALLHSAVITQTGAGGAGAGAAEKRVALPVDVHRYIRVKATNSVDADASAKSLTAQLVF